MELLTDLLMSVIRILMSNSPNYLTFKKTQGSLKGESGSLLQVT